MKKDIWFWGVIALLAVVLIASTAFFSGLYFSRVDIGSLSKGDDFGTFGDYFGGMLGTLVAFISAILFFLALYFQRKDLELTRKTLEDQKEQLSLQVKATQDNTNKQLLIKKVQVKMQFWQDWLELRNRMRELPNDTHEKIRHLGQWDKILSEMTVIMSIFPDHCQNQFQIVDSHFNECKRHKERLTRKGLNQTDVNKELSKNYSDFMGAYEVLMQQLSISIVGDLI